MTSLQPVEGEPRALLAVLEGWLGASGEVPPLVVRTSGSTGGPKDVVLSRAAVLASTRASLARLGGPGQWLLALPAHHVAGLQVLVRSLLGGAAPVLLDEHPSLEAATAAMTGERRYVSLVPTQLVRLLERPGQVEALRRFDTVLLGGAAADPALVRAAREGGIAVVTSYGMSETCGGCVYDGLPLADLAVKLDAEDRICLGGPVLFDGYRDRPDLTESAFADGMLRTQDLGAFDADGLLQVLGRVDDVMVSGGVNVALPAVECRLREHPGIDDAAVLGADDAEWGARVVAVVVPAAGSCPSLAELRDFVSARLPRSWAPRDLVVVLALPLLATGKLDRAALRELV